MVLAISRAPFPDATGLFKDMPQEADYIGSLTSRMSQEIDARSRDDSARASLLLQSPSGTVFAVYVNDAGALTTQRV
jgi:hypothetical protein